MWTHSEKLKGTILKFGVAAVLLVVPLYPKFPFLRIPGSQVSLRLEDVLVFVLVFYWFLATKREWLKYLKNHLMISILLFWVVGAISLLSAVLVTKTAEPHIALLHWVRRIEYMSLFFVGLSAVREKRDTSFYIKCLSFVVIIAFIYGVGQKHFNWPVITTQNYEYAKGIALRYVDGSHLFSTFAGHYDMATYLIFVTPIFYVAAFSSAKVRQEISVSKSQVFTIAYFSIVILLGLWLLVNAASRISIVSYLGSVTLVLFIIRQRKLIPMVLAISLIFIGLSSNLISRYTRILEVTVREVISDTALVPRISAQEDAPSPVSEPVFEDRSTSIRLNVEWPRALRAFTKNPLLGTGYSSITLATDNDYLRLIGEVGMAGALAFFLVLFRVITRLAAVVRKKLSLETTIAIGALAAIPGVLLNMVFIDILEASKFAISFWLILGIAISSMNIIKNE